MLNHISEFQIIKREFLIVKKFNKRDLVQIVADEGHLSKKDARNALDLCFDLIEKALLEGQEVNITNFGAFSPKTRKKRDGTDPKKHTRITIKESRTVTFRLAKSLKAKLNK